MRQILLRLTHCFFYFSRTIYFQYISTLSARLHVDSWFYFHPPIGNPIGNPLSEDTDTVSPPVVAADQKEVPRGRKKKTNQKDNSELTAVCRISA